MASQEVASLESSTSQEPTDAHQTLSVSSTSNDALAQNIQSEPSKSESHNTCDKPAVACWIFVFTFILVPIWVSLVLADVGVYIGCRIFYNATHYMAACCWANALSTNTYKTDGDRNSEDFKTTMTVLNIGCSLLSCVFSCYLYVAAIVSFQIAKLAIKILPYILPVEGFRQWIENHDKNFEWSDPRINPTHTITRIRTESH